MGKRRFVVVGLSLVVTGIVAAGCAQGQGGAAQPEASATPTPTPSTSISTIGPTLAPDPTLTVAASASRTKGTVGGAMTIRGQVEDGVEAGCMVLKTDGGTVYLLVGGDRQIIAAGARVEVAGSPQPDLMTTCQQGVPFQVNQVRKI